MDPYLAKDMAYAEQQDREWLRSLAVEQRAAEILADPWQLECAIGDADSSTIMGLLSSLVRAKPLDIFETVSSLQNELTEVADRQAEKDIKKAEQKAQEEPAPMFLRRQAE